METNEPTNSRSNIRSRALSTPSQLSSTDTNSMSDSITDNHSHPSSLLPQAEEVEKNVSLLDIKNFQSGQRYQISRRRKLLRFLETWDHKVSYPIHQLRWGTIGDSIVLIPALLFSAYSIPILIFLAYFTVPLPIAFTLTIGCIVTLFITANLKKFTRRIRPGLHIAADRIYNIRAWEKTNALPSGDSAQAGLWLTVLAIYTDNPYLYWLIPCTPFGRVYFACHWVGDTIVGAFIGIVVGHVCLSVLPGVYAKFPSL